MSKLGESLIKGLEEALAWHKGEIELRVTEVEALEKTRVDKEPDGKQELDYGKEELDKDKKKKKKKDEDFHPVNIDETGEEKRPDAPQAGDLSKRWDDIKKSLDSDSAFLDVYEASGLADEEREEQEAPPEGGVEEEDMEEGAAAEEEVADAEGDTAAEEYAEENPEMAEMAEDEEAEPSEEELIEALRAEGHDDAEIAFILHGHGAPTVDPVDQSKIAMNEMKSQHQQASHEHDLDHKKALSSMEREHKKRMQDLEYDEGSRKTSTVDDENEHKKRMLELEYEHQKETHEINKLDLEHKKRMLDLEYETAQKEKEIELKGKEQEMEIKLKDKENQAKQKMSQKQEIDGIKHQQKVRDAKRDAKQTSIKEREGKLEKSAKLWSHNPKTGQMNHPEHGSVAFSPHQEGIEIRHNGKSVGVHADKASALQAAKDYMVNLSKPIKVGASVGGKSEQ